MSWFKKSPNELWKLHREEFLRIYSHELTEKTKASNLEHRYTDLNGIAYFGFPKNMSLPVDRLGKLYYYSEYLFKGLSPEEDAAIDKAMTDALELGLSNHKEKSSPKIGALLMEREKRRKMIIHHEVIYNLLAVQWVREDEDVSTFNNEIQMQKVVQFQKEVEVKGAYPFFQVPELIQLNSFLKTSKEEWERFWSESVIQQKTLKLALEKVYSSAKKLPKSKGSSTRES